MMSHQVTIAVYCIGIAMVSMASASVFPTTGSETMTSYLDFPASESDVSPLPLDGKSSPLGMYSPRCIARSTSASMPLGVLGVFFTTLVHPTSAQYYYYYRRRYSYYYYSRRRRYYSRRRRYYFSRRRRYYYARRRRYSYYSRRRRYYYYYNNSRTRSPTRPPTAAPTSVGQYNASLCEISITFPVDFSLLSDLQLSTLRSNAQTALISRINNMLYISASSIVRSFMSSGSTIYTAHFPKSIVNETVQRETVNGIIRNPISAAVDSRTNYSTTTAAYSRTLNWPSAASCPDFVDDTALPITARSCEDAGVNSAEDCKCAALRELHQLSPGNLKLQQEAAASYTYETESFWKSKMCWYQVDIQEYRADWEEDGLLNLVACQDKRNPETLILIIVFLCLCCCCCCCLAVLCNQKKTKVAVAENTIATPIEPETATDPAPANSPAPAPANNPPPLSPPPYVKTPQYPLSMEEEAQPSSAAALPPPFAPAMAPPPPVVPMTLPPIDSTNT